MTAIPQRELRNNVSNILRRAEAGERFTVTVDGRPVAELGPLALREPARGSDLARILADNPVDSGWAVELSAERDAERSDNPDPWSA